MNKPTRPSIAMLVTAAALSAAVSAPAVFAEEGHSRHGSDDVVTMPTPINNVDDNDVNDDHGVDAGVTTTAGTPIVRIEDRNHAVDDID